MPWRRRRPPCTPPTMVTVKACNKHAIAGLSFGRGAPPARHWPPRWRPRCASFFFHSCFAICFYQEQSICLSVYLSIYRHALCGGRGVLLDSCFAICVIKSDLSVSLSVSLFLCRLWRPRCVSIGVCCLCVFLSVVLFHCPYLGFFDT